MKHCFLILYFKSEFCVEYSIHTNTISDKYLKICMSGVVDQRFPHQNFKYLSILNYLIVRNLVFMY